METDCVVLASVVFKMISEGVTLPRATFEVPAISNCELGLETMRGG